MPLRHQPIVEHALEMAGIQQLIDNLTQAPNDMRVQQADILDHLGDHQ